MLLNITANLDNFSITTAGHWPLFCCKKQQQLKSYSTEKLSKLTVQPQPQQQNSQKGINVVAVVVVAVVAVVVVFVAAAVVFVVAAVAVVVAVLQ